jgi:hypothetical protein
MLLALTSALLLGLLTTESISILYQRTESSSEMFQRQLRVQRIKMRIVGVEFLALAVLFHGVEDLGIVAKVLLLTGCSRYVRSFVQCLVGSFRSVSFVSIWDLFWTMGEWDVADMEVGFHSSLPLDSPCLLIGGRRRGWRWRGKRGMRRARCLVERGRAWPLLH